MDTDNIRQAVLEKAKAEANSILKEAEAKAEEIIRRAQSRKEKETEDEKNRIISEANRESARILAQASLKARQEILKQKDQILTNILEKVTEELKKKASDKKTLTNLVKESLMELKAKEARLLVAAKDRETVQKILKDIKHDTVEVKEVNSIGGIVAETKDSLISIDNSFETRLKMLLPRILPDVGKKLFGDV